MIFSKIGTLFDFASGFWSAGISGDVTINFQGYRRSQLVNSSTDYLLKRDVIIPITLNCQDIDYFVINSSAGVWVADNLDFSRDVSAVPVPAPLWLFGTAILGFLGLRRKSI